MGTHTRVRVDAVIFGGGVSGLWTCNTLISRGLNVILVETQALGQDQTITCQGILHGGVKYSLAGKLTKAAINIKEMPGIWKEHIQGQRFPDLSNLDIRSDYCYLWGKSVWLLGSLLGLSIRPGKIQTNEYPEMLSNYKGDVYKLPEQIISPKSLLEVLSKPVRKYLVKTHADQIKFKLYQPGQIAEIELKNPNNQNSATIIPNSVIFTAGGGNSILRKKAGMNEEKQQQRPLRMVLVKSKELPAFNGHYVEGTLPTVTITSNKLNDGNTVWMLGGKLAENGTKWTDEKMIQETLRILKKVFPQTSFDLFEMTVFNVDRAEADTRHCKKPDDVFVEKEGNVITAWPTKLVLAPRLAERIADTVQLSNQENTNDANDWSQNWEKPVIAMEPWESADKWYTVSWGKQG